MESSGPDHDALRESRLWLCTKHLLQVGVAAAAVSFVLEGGSMPIATLAWIGAGLIAMVCLVLVDRQLFHDAGRAQVEVVELLVGMQEPLVLDAQPGFGYVHPADVPFLVSVT